MALEFAHLFRQLVGVLQNWSSIAGWYRITAVAGQELNQIKVN